MNFNLVFVDKFLNIFSIYLNGYSFFFLKIYLKNVNFLTKSKLNMFFFIRIFLRFGLIINRRF